MFQIRSIPVVCLAIAMAMLCTAQQVLNNETIVRLASSGLGDDLLANMINTQPGQYSLDPDNVMALKRAHISDKVISAMMFHSNGAGAPPSLAVVVPATVVLHDGTPVRLRLSRNLSSADAKTGDSVDFEVLDDIKADDVLVVARGSSALGTVTEAHPRGRMGKGGKLDVTIDYVRMVNGEKAALRAVRESSGGGHQGAMTAGIVASALIVWPAAPFFLFMHGKDSTMPKDTEITAYVNGEISINPSSLRKR